MSAKDLLVARKARKHGARYTVRIVREAKAAGIPASLGFAIVEQESGFKNIFGADQGSILHHMPVTRENVQRLIRYVRKGGLSNGVGLTQLTYLPLILEAEKMGGAHKPTYQLRVAFRFLHGLRLQHGLSEGLARYNGSGPAAENYRKRVAQKAGLWHLRLTP